MLSLNECRRTLGPVGESLSDEEVLEIRDALRALAEIAWEARIKPLLKASKLSTTAPQSTESKVVE